MTNKPINSNKNSGMSLIVKTISRLISGLIFLYGIYIVAHGHLTPGGGFGGGMILASSFILMVLSLGSERKLSERFKLNSSLAESLGILIFWFLAIFGLILGSIFFLNFLGKGRPFHLLSGGIIPLCNIGIGLEVAGAISAVFIIFIIWKEKGE